MLRGARLFRSTLVTATVMLCLSAPAYAATPHGVIGGLGVRWYGTAGTAPGSNVIYVNPGNGYIDGNFFSWSPPGSINVPSGMSGNIAALAASTVYYLYAICPGGPKILLSTVPPTTEGRPTAVIADARACQNNLPFNNDQLGLFIGSILTDGNAGIIPFSREGDVVTLMPLAVIDGNFVSLQWGGYTVPAGGAPACTSAAVSFTQFPQSASGLLLDVTVQNVSGTTFAIQQPYLGATSQCGLGGNFNPQWIGTNALETDKERLLVKTSQSCSPLCTASVYLTVPTGGNAGDGILVAYAGYVEKIESINNF